MEFKSDIYRNYIEDALILKTLLAEIKMYLLKASKKIVDLYCDKVILG